MKAFLTTLMIGISSLIHAATAVDTFVVMVGSDTIAQGDILEVKFLLKNIDGQIERPDFAGFEIVGGPNQSSSFQFINGKSASSISHSYWLRAPEPGVFYLGPVYVKTGDGGTLESGPVEISVLPESGDAPTRHGVIEESADPNSLWQHTPAKPKLKTRKI